MSFSIWSRPVMLSLALAALCLAPSASQGQVPSDKKYVIIHSDDAGMSHSVNRATIEAMEHGIVSSSSIMVPCPWFPEIAAYAKSHPEKDFGLHMTLNCEWEKYRWGPVAPRDKVPSLVDPDGYMWSGKDKTVKNAKANEVEIELRAQIERAKQFGVPITHLDTHMGTIYGRPDFVEVFLRLGLEYDIPVFFVKRSAESVALPKEFVERIKAMTVTLESKGLPVLDAYHQFYSPPSQEFRNGQYKDSLRSIKPGEVHEIIIHCGYDDEELKNITSSSTNRDGDRVTFTSEDMKNEVQKLGIELLTWKQFHAMQKNKVK